MPDNSQTQTLNIPSLVFVVILATFTIRYFFFSNSSSSASGSSSTSASALSRRGANPQHVEQIASMFPQVGRREIMWDLQGNGGSVAATTERILGGRGLDVPPPSYRPIIPPSATNPTSSSSPGLKTSSHPDLITRYNLASRLSPTPPVGASEQEAGRTKTEAEAEAGKTKTKPLWSNNQTERQALLQRRREEMVLNARRKLEAEERAAGR